ncbi:uncharacterized protein A1O5_03155 [Cladophialophora psammophila CBS 110553]|uniref:Uncharacterized protein n=1 Tax=Cladophialophora psammophila CBS 110553 TaxID=1182543 RepID=W9X7W3_9EURO|nr:uncharacterized protein A1O5_03155 [Cladophialophora psammophila CBS 110553]EXJ73395.1 hypothetical protein A1O5_03155 [Cladophialophora psammophila CBS 110553]
MFKPKARVTMAMLLVSSLSQCAKSRGALEPCSKGQVRFCQEYSVEDLTAHHPRPRSMETIDDEIGRTEQLDLPLRHSTQSHEIEIAAALLEQASDMTSQSDTGQAIEAPIQEAIATNNPHSKSEGKRN